MKYDLKDLVTFSQIAKMKSFTKGAETLGIAKNVATTRINNLEKSVGMNLLARTTREVNLTPDGKNFLEYCTQIINKAHDLDNFLDRYKEISGTLQIAIPPYFSRYHIVPYLQEFLETYPKLKLEITLTEDPVNVINECYDLQIRIMIPQDEGLEVAKLMTNHKIVCASPSYIKKHGEPKTPADLKNHNCIVFGENDVWEFQHKKTKTIESIKHPAGNIWCNNGEIIKELVMSDAGITLKSSRDSEDEIKSGKIKLLLEDYKIMNKTEFYIVYPSGNIIPPKTKAFIDFFQNKLKNKAILSD